MDTSKIDVKEGLRTLSQLVVRSHRKRAGWEMLANGGGSPLLATAREQMLALEATIAIFSKLRHKHRAREVRKWARTMTLNEAHRSTKSPEDLVRKTASARKGHIGERTSQAAADLDSKEWGKIRQATDDDQSEAIVKAVEGLFALGKREGDQE